MKIALAVFFFTVATTVSQEMKPIITDSENKVWLEEIRSQDLQEKLEMIKDRWKADTAVAYFPTAIPSQKASEKNRKTKYRPLYLFVNCDNELLFFPSNPSSDLIAEVSKMLTAKNVLEMRVETEPEEVGIYGVRGLSGLIYVKLTGDAVYEDLKEVLRQ